MWNTHLSKKLDKRGLNLLQNSKDRTSLKIRKASTKFLARFRKESTTKFLARFCYA